MFELVFFFHFDTDGQDDRVPDQERGREELDVVQIHCFGGNVTQSG